MKEFLERLGITPNLYDVTGHSTDDNSYVLTINSSNDYSKIFSILEKSNLIHEVEDDSVFDLDNNTLYFESEDYDIELNANLTDDEYSLVLTEKVDE